MRNPLVEWVCELDDEGTNGVIGDAIGFLVALQWDEPLGLAFIGALSTRHTTCLACSGVFARVEREWPPRNLGQ